MQGTFSVVMGQSYPYDVDTKPVRGFMPNGDYLTSPFDSIDPTSGKLHLQIPLASLPRGRAGAGFDLEMVYDSHLYDIEASPDSQELIPAIDSGGWAYNFQNFKLELEDRTFYPLDSGACSVLNPELHRAYRLRIGLPDGSLHVLHLRGFGADISDNYIGDGFYAIAPNGKRGPCAAYYTPMYPSDVTGRLTYFTSDGSFLKLEIIADGSLDWWNKDWRLYFPDGRRAIGQGAQLATLIDSNGNQIHFTNDCYDPPPGGDCDRPYTIISDDFNRQIKVDRNITGAAEETATEMTDKVTVTRASGDLTWTIDWEAFTIGGIGNNRYYTCYQAGTPDCLLNVRNWGVRFIKLTTPSPPPDPPKEWRSFEFRYSDNADQGFGEVDYVRVPSGAIFNYRYRLEGAFSSTVWIAHKNGVSQKSITHDLVTDLTWTYTYNETTTIITNPDGGQTTYAFNDPINIHLWDRGLVNQITAPLGSVRKRIWAQNKTWDLRNSGNADSNNAFIKKEIVSVGNAAGTPFKSAITEYVYEKNGNVRSRTEHDWVFYPNETGTAARIAVFTHNVVVPNSDIVTDDLFAYWQGHHTVLWPDPTSTRRLNAVQRQETRDGSNNVKAVTEFEYVCVDDPLKNCAYTTGNVTAEKRWDSVKSASVPPLGTLTASNSVVLARNYNINGDLTEILPPAIHTQITYASVPGFSGPGPYPTVVEYAPGMAERRTWNYSWDYVTGSLLSKQDGQNTITTAYTYDPIDRRLTVTEAGLRKGETIYDDILRKITVKRDLGVLNDGNLQTRTHYDQLGRIVRVQTSDGSPLVGDTDGINVETSYLMVAGGRRVVTSTPYRNTSEATLEWTCTQYDTLDRVTAVAMFKGATAPTDCQSATNRTGTTLTQSDADVTHVTDPAGKARDQYQDALGRMVRVTEDPSGQIYVTRYWHDPLDNLCRVGQYDTGVVLSVKGRLGQPHS